MGAIGDLVAHGTPAGLLTLESAGERCGAAARREHGDRYF